MGLLLAAAVLIAAGGTLFTYRNGPKNPSAYALYLLRFTWMFGLLLLAVNPTCTRTETRSEKPLLLIANDVSGSFQSFQRPVPKSLTDVFDTLVVPFGAPNQTQLDSLVQRAPARAGGKRIAAVWSQTDGMLTQGISWTDALSTLGNPVFFAAIPKDSVLRSGWELVEIQFPSEVLVGQTYSGTAVWVHRGLTSARASFSLQWGEEVIEKGVLLPASGRKEQVINFNWTPKSVGIRQLKSSKGVIGKSVQVRKEKPKLVVFGGPLHPDAAYFVHQLCAQRTVEVYYRFGPPEATDFDASIWLLSGGKPVAGEEQFSGNILALPAVGSGLLPADAPPVWPGESYGIPSSQGWMQVPKPRSISGAGGSLRWEVGYVGYAAAARHVDSIRSRMPSAWLDRLWTVDGKQSLRIRFPDPVWSGAKVDLEAVWTGWTPGRGVVYPQITLQMEDKGNQKYTFLPDGEALKTQLKALRPGLYPYRASGTFGGEKRTTQGQFEVLSAVLENERAADFSLVRKNTSRLGGAWCWLDETDSVAAALKSDSRFQPVLLEQKKSRQWRDFWWAYLIFGLSLGLEAVLRKRYFGRA